MNTQSTKTDAALRMTLQIDRREIGNKIDDPIFELSRFQLAAKKILLSGEAVGKFVGDIEDKIRRVIKIHHQREVIGGDKTNRLARRSIEVLMFDIQRRRKEAS